MVMCVITYAHTVACQVDQHRSSRPLHVEIVHCVLHSVTRSARCTPIGSAA